MDYVLIYCLNNICSDKVLVLVKDKPDWMSGRINLLGGKIEPKETIEEAATRELLEEAGYKSLLTEVAGLIVSDDDRIYCCRTLIYSHDDPCPRDGETEKPFWISIKDVLKNPDLMPNLRIIIPLMHSFVNGWKIYDSHAKFSEKKGMHKIQLEVPTLNEDINYA